MRTDSAVTSAKPDVGNRLIHVVSDYRFLTAPQLARLFELTPRAVALILHRLDSSGYLAAVRRPVLHEHQPDTVYALAQRGANQVAADLGIDRRLVRWRKYHNLVGLPYVEHRLATNDVRIALTVGGRRAGSAVEHWRYEVPIKEQVDDPDERVPPLILRPDAYIRLLEGSRRAHFFLEVDLATETHSRWARKIRLYLAYRDSRLFRYRLGARGFRVLTVAPSVTRLRSLKRVAEQEGAARAFWFTSLDHMTPNAVGGPIWRLAGEDAPAALFGSGDRTTLVDA